MIAAVDRRFLRYVFLRTFKDTEFKRSAIKTAEETFEISNRNECVANNKMQSLFKCLFYKVLQINKTRYVCLFVIFYSEHERHTLYEKLDDI